MDPNETLKQLREAINQNTDGSYGDLIAELFGSLDDWLSRGGFLPEVWRRADSEMHRECDKTIVELGKKLDNAVRNRLVNDAGTSMYVIEDKQLHQMLAQLNHGTSIPTYKLRISMYPNHFTYKINEGSWSPPVGRAQEPY